MTYHYYHDDEGWCDVICPVRIIIFWLVKPGPVLGDTEPVIFSWSPESISGVQNTRQMDSLYLSEVTLLSPITGTTAHRQGEVERNNERDCVQYQKVTSSRTILSQTTIMKNILLNSKIIIANRRILTFLLRDEKLNNCFPLIFMKKWHLVIESFELLFRIPWFVA